jgi:hypothetical protein
MALKEKANHTVPNVTVMILCDGEFIAEPLDGFAEKVLAMVRLDGRPTRRGLIAEAFRCSKGAAGKAIDALCARGDLEPAASMGWYRLKLRRPMNGATPNGHAP